MTNGPASYLWDAQPTQFHFIIFFSLGNRARKALNRAEKNCLKVDSILDTVFKLPAVGLFLLLFLMTKSSFIASGGFADILIRFLATSIGKN